MAITPRTVLSEPINLLVFAFGVFAVGGVVGLLAGGDGVCERAAPALAEPMLHGLDASAIPEAQGPATDLDAVGELAASSPALDHTCRLAEPSSRWGEAEWLRHLECMEARGESKRVLLSEADAGIEAVGLTPDLALTKADYLEVVGTVDELIVFLSDAVNELGVADGQIVHRLARALIWRGHDADLERVRRLQILSRLLMPESCEVLQTDVWMRHALAERVAAKPSPVARMAVQRAVETYINQGCHERIHDGHWDTLAEIVGVGVAAEASNGHDGQSTLLRQVAHAFDIRQVDEFCRQAVPAGNELRGYCEKRVGDELFLSRR